MQAQKEDGKVRLKQAQIGAGGGFDLPICVGQLELNIHPLLLWFGEGLESLCLMLYACS